MLEQRENSWAFGIGLMYSVEGTPFNPPQNAATLIEDIEREIAANPTKRGLRRTQKAASILKRTNQGNASNDLCDWQADTGHVAAKKARAPIRTTSVRGL